MSATQIKQQVVSLVNKQLVDYLRAMQQVDDDTYGDFARTVARIIADINLQVKKRAKKKKNE